MDLNTESEQNTLLNLFGIYKTKFITSHNILTEISKVGPAVFYFLLVVFQFQPPNLHSPSIFPLKSAFHSRKKENY